MKKIFLSGPISGRGNEESADHFMNAMERLFVKAGEAKITISIANPVIFCQEVPKDADWHTYMKACVKRLADSDGIALLQGWEKSKGAKLEVKLAQDLHIPVVYVEPPMDETARFSLFDQVPETYLYFKNRADTLLKTGTDECAVDDIAFYELAYRFLDPEGFTYITPNKETEI